MSDITPFRSNSKASRHIMFALPVDAYVLNEQHVNFSLQALYDAVVKDLNYLAEHGVETDKGVAWRW